MDRKFVSLAALLWLFPAASKADPHADLLQSLSRCAALADSTARLACYDRLAPQVKTALEPQTSESWFGLDTLFGSGKPQTTPQAFGQERLAKPAEEKQSGQQIDSISAILNEVAKTPFGKFIVFLDNGQVWRQIAGDPGQARFERDPKQNRITISRGALGSYVLTINGSARSYKVQRMK